MRYCPNANCPHRKACGVPAEFLDCVVVCTDCETSLVDDHAVALAGATPVDGSAAAHVTLVHRATRAQTDLKAGVAHVVISIFGLISCLGSWPWAEARALFFTGELLYGAYRLNRGRSAPNERRARGCER